MGFKKLYSGEHLKKINPNWTYEKWSYKHTFESKMRYVTSILNKVPKDKKILDAGCGQGLLVEHFKKKGYDIIGVDAFYESEHVRKDDILKSGFKTDTFDIILNLDVIEHFQLHEQESVMKELNRILKPSGQIIYCIPNMAHLSSRVFFLLFGRLLRTAKVSYHPGDRPIAEYYDLLKKEMCIVHKRGLSPTVPVLFQMTQLVPQYTGWLYSLITPFRVFPNWCFNVVVIVKKN